MLSQSASSVANRQAAPVLLTIYVYDQCGGCETEGPGCGQCKALDKIQGMARAQLGDRLYDGSIEYRTYNTRTKAHALGLIERSARYGAPDELAGVVPVAFIGTDAAGLYLPGEALMPHVGEMMDRYMGGESVAKIQDDIMAIYYSNINYND